MIKLSLVKKFGVELVNGDMITSSGKSGSAYMIGRTAATYFNGTNNEDYRRVESFATRLISDGIPDSIDGDVLLEITNGNGLVLHISASNVAWHAWKTWRPSMEWLVQQSAEKPVAYKDDTQHFGADVPKGRSEPLNESIKEADYISKGFMSRCVVMPFQEGYSVGYRAELTELAKPTFTQSMADAGELPPVGSEFMCLYNSNDESYARCLSVGLTSKGLLVHEFLETPNGKRIGDVDYSDGKFPRIPEFKPLDTRTPKQKAVDAAFLAFNADKDTLGSIYDYWMGGDFKK